MKNETQCISSMEMIEIIKTYMKRNVRPEHYMEAPDHFLDLCEAGLYMGLFGFPTNILEKHIPDKKVVNAYIDLLDKTSLSDMRKIIADTRVKVSAFR